MISAHLNWDFKPLFRIHTELEHPVGRKIPGKTFLVQLNQETRTCFLNHLFLLTAGILKDLEQVAYRKHRRADLICYIITYRGTRRGEKIFFSSRLDKDVEINEESKVTNIDIS